MRRISDDRFATPKSRCRITTFDADRLQYAASVALMSNTPCRRFHGENPDKLVGKVDADCRVSGGLPGWVAGRESREGDVGQKLAIWLKIDREPLDLDGEARLRLRESPPSYLPFPQISNDTLSAGRDVDVECRGFVGRSIGISYHGGPPVMPRTARVSKAATRPILRLLEPPTISTCRINIGPYRFSLAFAADGFETDKPSIATDIKTDDGKGCFRFTPIAQ